MNNKIKAMPWKKWRRKWLGMNLTDGLLFKIILYALLIIIGFVYVYPLLHMLSYSLKSLADLLDPTINLLPSSLYFDNFSNALIVLDYGPLLLETLTVTLIPAVLQTIVASLIGYGFARFNFPLKRLWFMLLIATYIIPPQVTMIPRYVLFFDLGILETIYAIILPATFGQGVSSAIFVLIFYQFYSMVPKALDEAAQLDGANRWMIYTRIAIPLSLPSFLTSFLFSFVWYWNETYLTRLFLGNGGETLLLRLLNFVSAYNATIGGGQDVANEAIRMAATLLIIAPLLLAYFLLQRLFIEGVDRSGITGE
jgi:multiple sugar transport system permease protein